MRKRFTVFIVLSLYATVAFAATRDAQLTNTTPYNYNYMYPYLNNQMRTDLNPGASNSQLSNPINVVVKTQNLTGNRRVVARPQRTRSATNTTATPRAQTNRTGVATAANTARASTAATSAQRRVVPRQNTARSGTTVAQYGGRTVVPRSAAYRATRTDSTAQYQRSGTTRATEVSSGRVSSVRCMSDYTECMNNYCERADTAYNRCYCSSKLAQIDYKYQTEIDNLVKQILTIQGTNNWSDEEMNEYWMATVGKYSDSNSWKNLESALNIDWATMESRVRGQTAFATGHEYCVQYLRNCSYMASNLRDAYKSEIGRDCATYEESLIRLKNVAESVISSYK